MALPAAPMTDQSASPTDAGEPFGFTRSLSDTSQRSFFHLKQPYRSFQVLKTNPLALAWPALYLLVHPTGGNAQSSSPAYHSSKLTAVRQKPWLPPTFKLFTGGSVPKDSKDENEEGKRLVKVKYTGWEGLVGMKAEIEITKEVVGQDNEETNVSQISLRRKGAGREYTVSLQGAAQTSYYGDGLVWKGSKSALTALLAEQREEQGQNGQVPREQGRNNGNLKLISPSHPEKGVLAVWQNKTDTTLMGNLFLFEGFDEGHGELGLLEEVVGSCLAVVAAERVSLRGWLGGVGKGKGKSSHEAPC